MLEKITLTSDSSPDTHPHNSPTSFVCALPDHLRPDRNRNCFYVRLLSISLCTEAEGLRPRPDVAWAYISEAEGGRTSVNSGLDFCLGQLQLPDEGGATGSVYGEFAHSPYLRLTGGVPLHCLGVHLADERGAPLSLKEQHPTVVTLEVTDDPSMGEQFQLVGYSSPRPTLDRAADEALYPGDDPADFYIPLPTEITLDDSWEVALTSLTTPASAVNSDAWMRVDGGYYYFDTTRTPDAESLVREVVSALVLVRDRLVGTLTTDEETGEKMTLALATPDLDEGEFDDPVDLQRAKRAAVVFELSDFVLARLGLFGEERAAASPISMRPSMMRRVKIPVDPRTPIYDTHPPAGLVYCSVVRPRIVGGARAPLLATAPIGQHLFSKKAGFFEPRRLLFVDVVPQKHAAVRIYIRRVDGRPYPLHTVDARDSTVVTLLFRRKGETLPDDEDYLWRP